MFGFVFRSATYFIIWKKFRTQIISIAISLIAIVIIINIYNDLFEIMSINNKEDLLNLMLSKWILICSIIAFNLYRLKQVKLDESEKKELLKKSEPKKPYPKKSQELLDKQEQLATTTDLILKKYMK